MNRFGLTRMDLWLRLSISVSSPILITSAATQRGVMGFWGLRSMSSVWYFYAAQPFSSCLSEAMINDL